MFTINVAKLEASHARFLGEHSAMVAGVLYDAGGMVIRETLLRPGFKPRTQATQRATETRVVRISGGKLLRITNDRPVATYMERGTKPHAITARKARMLRFLSGGAWVFRRSVRHPGTKPYWFLRNARDVAASNARQVFTQRMRLLAARRF